MKIIAITTVFLALFFTNSAISKENIEKTSQKQEKNTQKDEKQEEKPAINSEKTIKFHKPQTEAERALDEILRVENGLIKGSKLKREDMFTKGFIEDYERQEDALYKNGICDPGDLCVIDAVNILTCAQDNITDIGFLFYTNKIENDIIYISMLPRGRLNDQYSQNIKTIFNQSEISKYIFHNYAITKQNGKWKIDGICCSGSNFNHKYCINEGKYFNDGKCTF